MSYLIIVQTSDLKMATAMGNHSFNMNYLLIEDFHFQDIEYHKTVFSY